MKLMALLTIEDIADKFDGFMDKLIASSFIPVLVQLIATAVIFVVVAKFIFKPVRQILRTRQEYISKQISDSEEAKEKEQAVEEIRKEIIDVALQASEVVLNREITEDDNKRLVNEFVEDIIN